MKKSATGNDARRHAPGFTLLELILVLVVMSLVLAVAYPSMSRGKTAFHLRAVGRDLISSIRAAREAAVTEQRVMQVLIDTQDQQVTVSSDVGEDPRVFKVPGDIQMQILTPAGEPVEPGTLIIRFLPNGSSDDALIAIKAETGAALKIALDPIMGSARILANEENKTP